MRGGVCLLVVGVLTAAVAVGSARADGTATTSATATYAPLSASSLPNGCLGAGAAAIAEPGRAVRALGTPASGLGPSGYPASGAVIAFDSSTASGSTCKTATVTLASVSLFGGAVTASSIQATGGHGSVAGLSVDGTAVDATAGQILPVGSWGQLALGGTAGRLTAPLVLTLLEPHGSLPAGTVIALAFAASPAAAVAPTKHHASASPHRRQSQTPNATASRSHTGSAHPAKGKRRLRKAPVSQPQKVTPPLGLTPSHYVFPVDGGASYVDTYGANRSDVSGGWHHGDDLFAPLGTAVVAVANGTLSLVGWNAVGGWRLWLTDGAGNSFYYAHLAGYSRWILQHPHVRAGQVVGFLGRTGDAFTTTPHLHFEVHPHQLFKLGYDGAVDPTAYLQKWRIVHVPAKEMPRPARLKAPLGTPAEEASVVWHQLLVARHLLSPRSPAVVRQLLQQPALEAMGQWPPRVAAVLPAAVQAPELRRAAVWVGGICFGAAVVLSGSGFLLRRRRRRGVPSEVARS